VLEDDPHQPHFIETVATAGYRFIFPVETEAESLSNSAAPIPVANGAKPAAEPVAPAQGTPSASRGTRNRWAIIAASALLLLVAAVALWYIRRPLPPPRITQYVQLTNDGRSKGVWGVFGNTLYLNLWNPGYNETPGNTQRKDLLQTHIVDLKTHSTATLPRGPEPFWSPRWSPDGRYAAGLTNPDYDLEIFDFKTSGWTVLHPHQGPIDYPSWSHDGRFIYYLTGPNYHGVNFAERGVYRIPVTGGKPEKVAGLNGFRHTGYYSFWMGLDPDDNPLLLRDAGTDEIYALTLERM